MRFLITFFCVILVFFSFCTFVNSQCPEDPIDSGICDTLYVEPWPADIADSVWSRPGPYFVRVPIYVTHDLPNSSLDSLDGIVVPLCYTHTNPSKYCSVGAYWNNITLSGATVSRSVFRHFIQGSDTLVHNRMMDLFQQGGGRDWDTRIVNLDGTSHFWFVVIAAGASDQKWWEGSRVLLATMTLKLEDTMRISVDSCFWPPNNHLAFDRYGDHMTYCPRNNLPTSFRAGRDSIPFAPAVNYPNGYVPYSVFCGDLDGDGDLDLAVADYWDSNHVSILKNNGDGTFQSNVDYDAGSYPVSVFCADLDGDGDLDLAVTNYLGSYSVSILKNNGDGTFQSRVGYGAGDGPFSVFCADLDGDGDLDLAVANYYSNNVSILKNNGDGTFQAKVDYGVGATPVSVFCADLDGDGDLDLAVTNYNGGRVSILKNNGNGTFQTKVDYGILSYPYSVFCADLDGDADLDLAVAKSQSDTVYILKNNGDGTFQANVDYGAGEGPLSVFCADLDGDTDLDLAVANWVGDNVSILKNNGDGTFQAKVDYGVGDYPTSVFCADLDGDTDLDLVTTNRYSNNVSILKNLTQAPANQPPWAFHLIYPGPMDTTQHLAPFSWRIPYDPNLGDQIRYDLFISTTPGFEPQTYIVDSNLVVPHQTDSLQIGTYYWKVKAKDNWGAYSWSQVTFSFFHSDYISDTLTIVAFSPVDLIVTDPTGDSTSLWFNTIPNALYDTTTDYNQDGDKDDIVTIPDRLVGEYQIEVITEVGGSGTYELGIRIDGGVPAMLTMPGGAPCPGPGEVDTFNYNTPWYQTGDANGDWIVDVGDVVYLINYLYKGSVSPDPLIAGDATCEGFVDVGDVVYLINYLFKGGPPPCE